VSFPASTRLPRRSALLHPFSLFVPQLEHGLTDKKALASGGGPYLNKNQRPPPDVDEDQRLTMTTLRNQ